MARIVVPETEAAKDGTASAIRVNVAAKILIVDFPMQTTHPPRLAPTIRMVD